MNTEQYAMGAFVLIGLVNGIQLIIEKQYASFAKFALAVIAGGIFGYLKAFGLPSLEIGVALGVSSSGIYKVAQKIAGA